MRMRLAGCFIAIALFVSLSATSPVRSFVGDGARSPSKAASIHEGSSISASSYRSPGKLHKALISSQDLESLAQAKASGAIEIADYESFKLLAMDSDALQSAEEKRAREAAEQRDDASFTSASLSNSAASLAVRDDLNVLLLRSGAIDTTDDATPGTFVGMGRPTASYGVQSLTPVGSEISSGSPLRLVQFVGPIKRAWFEQLEASGVEPIAYVPNNGYLVRSDSNARARLMSRNEVAAAQG